MQVDSYKNRSKTLTKTVDKSQFINQKALVDVFFLCVFFPLAIIPYLFCVYFFLL